MLNTKKFHKKGNANVAKVSGRQHLSSASHRKMNITQFLRSTFGTWTFSVTGPTVWNSLPDLAVKSERFMWELKMHIFA